MNNIQPPYDGYRQPTPQAWPAPPSEYVPTGFYGQQPGYPPGGLYIPPQLQPVPYTWPAKGLALVGLILGLASIVLWFIPCLGGIVPVVGIAFSVLGWRAGPRKWMAISGLALSAAALALIVYNSALGSIFPH